MRKITIFCLAILALAAVAHAKTPRGIVMSYECRQVDPKVMGFSCDFKGNELAFSIHERFDEMTPDRRDRAEYEISKLALRYMELGGQSYTQRADFWPPDMLRVCSRVDGLPYKINCADIKMNE